MNLTRREAGGIFFGAVVSNVACGLPFSSGDPKEYSLEPNRHTHGLSEITLSNGGNDLSVGRYIVTFGSGAFSRSPILRDVYDIAGGRFGIIYRFSSQGLSFQAGIYKQRTILPEDILNLAVPFNPNKDNRMIFWWENYKFTESFAFDGNLIPRNPNNPVRPLSPGVV